MTAPLLEGQTEVGEISKEARAFDIFNRHSAGETFAAIARDYDISASYVAQLYHEEERRRHLPERWFWPRQLDGWQNMEFHVLRGLPLPLLQTLWAAGYRTFGKMDAMSDSELLSDIPDLNKLGLRKIRQHIALIKAMADA
ncbi:MAG TPA: hypothetical protein VL550_07930 [Rhodocyclaceae bacterium]|jgi:hypothetical protein|nr:hypothetical protein [Rhodocyclaceae bacterium]